MNPCQLPLQISLGSAVLGRHGRSAYIGTSDFNAAGKFRGTSLFSIPKTELFAATPALANITHFDTLAAVDGVNLTDMNRNGRIPEPKR